MNSLQNQESVWKISLCLAGFLLAVIILLSLVSSDEAIINKEQYEKLLEMDLIEGAVISENTFHGKLERPISFKTEYQSGSYDRVSVEFEAITPQMIEKWEESGIRLQFEGIRDESQSQSSTVAILVLVGFLSVGGWYIADSIVRSRREGLSEKVKELEKQRKAGTLSEAEYWMKRSELRGDI